VPELLASHFAPAARASIEQLAADIDAVTGSEVVEALLSAAGGLLAVVNEERQVVAVNTAFLRMVDATDAQQALGLRPGEVPGGCGTSSRCSTCGAALAIVAALNGQEPTERKCVLTVDRDGSRQDLCLRVRAAGLRLGERQFVLLFLQDVTLVERLSEVQRSFFHDVRNILMGLRGSAELLVGSSQTELEELSGNVVKLADQLAAEVTLQQGLCGDGQGVALGPRQPVAVSQVMRDVLLTSRNHSAASGKHLDFQLPPQDTCVMGDAVIVGRILLNMTLNALEASPTGGRVRAWVETTGEDESGTVVLRVWNQGVIPENVAGRIFQRHFSTKADSGRGIGTWGMKLLAEDFLNGQVSFDTHATEGTTFSVSLPAGLQPCTDYPPPRSSDDLNR
jgi:signal transduction histidine kinase